MNQLVNVFLDSKQWCEKKKKKKLFLNSLTGIECNINAETIMYNTFGPSEPL